MLRHITIHDFAIIQHLDLELDSGMTALTGETGAGKSILVDVIGLLLGDRADAGSIRDGAAQTDLSAEFEFPAHHPASQWLQEQALLAEADSEADKVSVLLRRVITRQGKGRAWINGRPTPITQLKQLGGWLVDIHGQHAHQQLLHRPLQRGLLDSFIDVGLLQSTQSAYQAWQTVLRQRQALSAQLDQAQDRLDLLRFQTSELADWGPTPDEYTAISQEHEVLAHAAEVITALHAAHAVIDSEDGGLDQGLSQALSALQDAARHEVRVRDTLDLLESARIQIQEVADHLRRLVEHIQVDEERLSEIDNRLAGYLRLSRKHRVEPGTLHGLWQDMQAELTQLEASDQNLEELDQAVAHQEQVYRQAATALSAARRTAVATLTPRVTETMQELGMNGGHFAIDLQEEAETPGPQGWDRIEFLVSANPGMAAQPLAKVASGGELSRIGLALQVLTSRQQTVDSLIFDEVDSGISGRVADVVGQKLRALGHHYQVLCVTHLPQVAAQAHQQWHVEKQVHAGQTRTQVRKLSATERAEVLAGMLGGAQLTAHSLAHARTMLEQASLSPGDADNPELRNPRTTPRHDP